MSEKFKPPRLDEDFTEDDFDRLLESKFGLGDELFSSEETRREGSPTDKTPATIVSSTDPDDDTKVPELKSRDSLIDGDPYDYTVPETKAAWVRLKARVSELEEANQDLRNQLELREELEDADSSDEELQALRQNNEILRSQVLDFSKKNEDLIQELARSRAEFDSLNREKDILKKGLEREHSSQNQELLRLMAAVDKTEESKLSLQEDVMRLEKELLDQKRLTEDERLTAQSRVKSLDEELKKKDQAIAEIRAEADRQLHEKTELLERIAQEHEQEYHTSILALQKEKNLIMDELNEQLSSMRSYVEGLEKEKAEWDQMRDQLTMKVGLLDDEKRSLNEQNIALVQETQAATHDLKDFRTAQNRKRDELKSLLGQMAGLLDQF